MRGGSRTGGKTRVVGSKTGVAGSNSKTRVVGSKTGVAGSNSKTRVVGSKTGVSGNRTGSKTGVSGSRTGSSWMTALLVLAKQNRLLKTDARRIDRILST